MNVPQYITQLTKSWIVDVSKKIVQGTCIRVDESGESRVISVDVEALKQFLDVGDIGDGTFVTTNTAQDVTGVKTFKGSQPVNLDANGGDFTRLRFTQGNSAIGYIGVYDHISPCDDMLGTVILGGNGGTGQGILIGSTSSGPEVRLKTAPTSHDSTTSLSVPTMGWVNDKFIRKSQIGVSGGVAAFGHSHSGYAASDHTHSGYAASNHSHSEYATTTALNALTSSTESLAELVGGIQEQIGSLEIETLTAAIDEYAAAKKTSVEAEIQAAGKEVLDNLDAYATFDEVEAELEDYVLKESLYDSDGNPLYVTTDTEQTITGKKTFSKGIKITDVTAITHTADNSYMLLCGSNAYDTGGHIVLGSNLATTNGGGIVSLRAKKDDVSNSLTLTPGTSSSLTYAVGGHKRCLVDSTDGLSIYSSKTDAERSWWDNYSFYTRDNVLTARIIGGIDSNGAHDCYLRAMKNNMLTGIRVVCNGVASTNSQLLQNPPTADSESTSDYQIAWRGWTNDKFIRKSKIDVTGGVASYGHTHSGYATTSALNSLSSTVSGLSSTVSGLSTTVSGLSSTVSGLSSSVSSLNNALDGLSDVVDDLIDVQLKQLDSKVDEIEEVANGASETATTANTNATNAQERIAAVEADYLTSDDLDDIITRDLLFDANDNPLYVTTNTKQTVTGVKTFKGSQPVEIDANGSNYTRIRFENRNAITGYIGSYDHVGTSDTFQGKASVIFGGGTTGEAQTLLVGTHDDYGTAVWMKAAPQDQTSTSALVVPTMGWVNDKFIRKDKGDDATPATEDKVLMLKQGATAYTEETAEFVPKNPASSVSLSASAGATALQTDGWTYSSNGTNGVVAYLTTRSRWTGTSLVEYRRPFTFSKNGMLYSVGAEVQNVVETPTVINWN